MDKFAEDDDTRNCEEFVTVQALLDEIKNKDIFVIATANERRSIPRSLLRSGRFDIKIEMDYPKEDESYEILEYYLKSKKINTLKFYLNIL